MTKETSCIECNCELPQGTSAVACPHCGALYCNECCHDHHVVGEIVTCKNCGGEFTMEAI